MLVGVLDLLLITMVFLKILSQARNNAMKDTIIGTTQ